MAKRLSCIGDGNGYPKDDPFRVTSHPDKLAEPGRWRKPRRVFVCSMGDPFHKDVSPALILAIYVEMAAAIQHTFIVCTKRPERLVPILYGPDSFLTMPCLVDNNRDHLPNVWHLTSVENQEAADKRIPELLKLREASGGWPVLGVSIEPCLGKIDLTPWLDPVCWSECACCKDPDCRRKGFDGRLSVINWVIVGGETGPGARPMHPDWVRAIRDQCQEAGVGFFFKSWGDWLPLVSADEASWYPKAKLHEWPDGTRSVCIGKKAAGRLLDGREWNGEPKDEH